MMRYAYLYLGEQRESSCAVVRWCGSGADVLLLDPVNFTRYRDPSRGPVLFSAGGHYPRSPARLSIPKDGRWYVVADLGGHSVDAKVTVEVLDAQPGQAGHEEALIGAR
jgi:Domain of unknown function (DUF1883)